MTESVIVDVSGRPFAPAAPTRGRASALNSGPGVPSYSGQYAYDASAIQTQEMGDWQPQIRSADGEINIFRDRMVARSRDLARNNGWANGGITRILDSAVGSGLRLSSRPNYIALQRFSSAFDAKWAHEFSRVVDALWASYADDIERYNDVTMQMTVGQQQRLGLRHKLIDGEDLVVNYWMPERMGRGAAQYATAFTLIDPDRLSNPSGYVDTRNMRGGIEFDNNGAPIAYNIRKGYQSDWYGALESMQWERVPRNDSDGWRRVIHDFDRDRAGQSRGLSVFTPVLTHMKMLARYYGVELQAATVASIFGTYVTSPYDPGMVQDALDGGDEELSFYQNMRAEWDKERPALLNGVRMPTLAPGEKIESVSAAHPNANFNGFAHEMLRSVAAALGVSTEQVTQDWSQTNYSSARAALLESWKTLTRRTNDFQNNTATPMFACWLSEAMGRGDLDHVLPRGAPDFIEAANAYARCRWLGPGRGWVDPVKEPQGSILKMDGALSTLERECAEQGLDWEETLDQRELEANSFKKRGLPMPNWYGNDAMNADKPEEEAQAK